MESPKSRSFLLKITVSLILAVVMVLGVWNALLAPSDAPETEVYLIDNQKISLKDLKGKVVILNFWATDCVNCVTEMPMLSQIYQRYEKEGLDLIAVALQRDDFQKVAQFAQKNALPFKVAYDAKGEIAEQWGPIQATPTTIVIDRKGRVVEEHVGILTQQQLEEVIEKKL